jgi:cell division protein FtsW
VHPCHTAYDAARFGMTVVIVFTWCVQLFLSGIPFVWIGIVAGLGVIGLIGAYTFFPHVTKRIDQFLDPVSGIQSKNFIR